MGNAAAVPVGVGDGSSATTSPHIAGAIAGLAGTEAPRRELTPVEQRALVWAEISDRRAAAERMAQLGRADDGERLLAEADALEGALNLE